MKNINLKIILLTFLFFCTYVNTAATQADNEPYINIVSPGAGEYLEAGKVYRIKWEQNNVDSVSVSYRNKITRVGDWIEFLMDLDINSKNGELDWLVPEKLKGETGEYEITIIGRVDNKNTTVNSDPFYIDWLDRNDDKDDSGAEVAFTVPKNNDKYEIGQTYNIKWSTATDSKKANFFNLWLDMGETEEGFSRILPITNFKFDGKYLNSQSHINTGSFNWKVPDNININEVDYNNAIGYDFNLFYDMKTYELYARGVKIYSSNGKILLPQPQPLKPGKYRIFATFGTSPNIFLTHKFTENDKVVIHSFGMASGLHYFSDYFEISDTKTAFSETHQQVNNDIKNTSSAIEGQNNKAINNLVENVQIKNKKMYKSLKGKIILKVESTGEAYYVHPQLEKMFYLGRPDDAFKVMREQGQGISNSDLYKMPIGLSSGYDSDGDGLSNDLESALGLNIDSVDTDSDGYSDKDESLNGYNPRGSGSQKIDINFSNYQKGKIFLQVEKKGEAWYVNPNDGKRYFLGRPADAYAVMRKTALGISNSDFDDLLGE
jgi:hypothetical protein